MTGKKRTTHAVMSGLKVIFSKLDKFTGNGDVDLRQWLRNFERCCVIAEKQDGLVLGQLLMLCVDGRAKAILDQFEEEKGEPPKLKDLKEQLTNTFDSLADRVAKMSQFETCIQQIGESEDEFMTAFLQLFCAATPSAKNEDVSHAVKHKFLHRISDQPRRNIFIFCTNPFDDKISHQDLLKARRDASIHLSTLALASTVNDPSIPEAVLTAGSTPEVPTSSSNPTLDAIMALSKKFDTQAEITDKKLEFQQQQINALQ